MQKYLIYIWSLVWPSIQACLHQIPQQFVFDCTDVYLKAIIHEKPRNLCRCRPPKVGGSCTQLIHHHSKTPYIVIIIKNKRLSSPLHELLGKLWRTSLRRKVNWIPLMWTGRLQINTLHTRQPPTPSITPILSTLPQYH